MFNFHVEKQVTNICLAVTDIHGLSLSDINHDVTKYPAISANICMVSSHRSHQNCDELVSNVSCTFLEHMTPIRYYTIRYDTIYDGCLTWTQKLSIQL